MKNLSVNFNKKVVAIMVVVIFILVTIEAYVMAGNKDEVKSIWIGGMNYFHYNAFLLPDGKVLLPGATAEIYDPKTKKFKVIGNMRMDVPNGTKLQSVPKETMLKDGRILLTGGVIFKYPTTYTLLKSAGIFDPQTGKIEKVGDMNLGRANHTTILLKDGKVLVVGKNNDNKQAELFDPATNKFTLVPNEMIYPRTNPTATLLNDGKVLIAGGAWEYKDGKNVYYSHAEIYDSALNLFYEVGSLNINRSQPKSFLLDNGNVLICGGRDVREHIGIYASLHIPCEIFDYKTQTFRLLNNFNEPRYGYGITKLSDGRVLFTGGVDGEYYMSEKVIDSIEIFDPEIEKFTTAGKMRKQRAGQLSVLLKDNSVFIACGGSSQVKNNLDAIRQFVLSFLGITIDTDEKNAEILMINNNKGGKYKNAA